MTRAVVVSKIIDDKLLNNVFWGKSSFTTNSAEYSNNEIQIIQLRSKSGVDFQ